MKPEEAVEHLRRIARKFYRMGESAGFYKDGATLFFIAQLIKQLKKDKGE